MEKLILTIPSLYADHHTTAVRRILQSIPGVADVAVSSAFHQVTMTLDPAKASAEAVTRSLADQGYTTGEGEPVYPVSMADRSTRHTATIAGTGTALAFAERTMVSEGRAMWPCPGFDPRTPHSVA